MLKLGDCVDRVMQGSMGRVELVARLSSMLDGQPPTQFCLMDPASDDSSGHVHVRLIGVAEVNGERVVWVGCSDPLDTTCARLVVDQDEPTQVRVDKVYPSLAVAHLAD